MRARSSVSGRGYDGSMRAWLTMSSHVVVSDTVVVRRSRDSRAFFTGSFSCSRMTRGIAFVTSIDTMPSIGTESGNFWIVATVLSHAIAQRAPWSSNWCWSSRGV